MASRTSGTSGREPASLSPDLVIVPESRRPIELPAATVAAALGLAIAPPPSGTAALDGRGGPVASIVVVTFNNLVCTKLCFESLLRNTTEPEYEVIVVDNGSNDGTVRYLEELARVHPNLRVLFNDTNRSFAAANNQGAVLATGDMLVFLNNDTIVPPGWLARLLRHLDDPAIGAVGPVTNRICNEAQIDTPYRTYGEMLRIADGRSAARDGERFDIRMLAMFCMAMRRSVFDTVGPIDEQFEVGMLEDEDYAIRIRNAGYRVVCAEDVFVHHFGEASFGALIQTGEYQTVYDRNRQRFEVKWGIRWEPYRQRRSETYRLMIDTLREHVRNTVPPGATVLLVSRGDDELLQLDGRRAWHFPRTDDGVYAGFHPADSRAAITGLEVLRRAGAEFLVFPATALWWLDHYTGFRQHLERLYFPLVREENTCVIFDLRVVSTENVHGASASH